ncbi:MAG: bacteriohemerythrin [bacterium]
MAIQWTEELGTGVDMIDNQHKELFKRINDLLDACGQGKGIEEVGKIIGFLEDYVVTHFSTEEKYMTQYDYPDQLTHKGQHRHFINNFSDLKKQFETDGAGVHIVILTNRVVVDWLNSHIRKVDKALGTFLKPLFKPQDVEPV